MLSEPVESITEKPTFSASATTLTLMARCSIDEDLGRRPRSF